MGGFIAEAVASLMDADGAVFNCPGVVALSWWKRVAQLGPHRPCFEVHLTRQNPLAAVFFPKPETHRHIAEVQWHPGKDHKAGPRHGIAN